MLGLFVHFVHFEKKIHLRLEKFGRFGIPLKHWLRGGMKKILLEFLDPNRLKKEGILDPLKVQSLVQEHLNGQANHSHLLWSLLCFEIWKEKTLQ